jgi:opacity protein-like surface antigen
VTRAAALFLLATQAYGQHLEIGIKGAARPTSQLEGYGTPESRPYLVGPMIQLNLPGGFAVEVDALYSRFGYTSSTSDIVGNFYTYRDRANSWQFPVLLKYRLHFAGLRPYVLAGWDPEHATGTTKTTGSVVSNPYDPNHTRTYQQFSIDDQYGTNHGLAAGGGVEFGGRHWRVSPEVRYVRWKNPMFSSYQSHGFFLRVPQNEVQLLVGVAWR